MSTKHLRLHINPYYSGPDPFGFNQDSSQSSPSTPSSSLSTLRDSWAKPSLSSSRSPQRTLMGPRSEWRLCFVLCLFDFHSNDPDHLSFRKNEMLEIVQKEESGWWAAMRELRIGWIPSSFVAELSDVEAEKLRMVKEEIRVYEFEAEKLYTVDPNRSNSYPINSAFPFIRSHKQAHKQSRAHKDVQGLLDGEGPVLISLRGLFDTDLLDDAPQKEEDSLSSVCATLTPATMETNSVRHAATPEGKSSSSTLTLYINNPVLLPSCSPSPSLTPAHASPHSPYLRARSDSDPSPGPFSRRRPVMTNDIASLPGPSMYTSTSATLARHSEDALTFVDDDLCSTYDAYKAHMPPFRRSNKVLQLTGDDDAQAFHNAKLALASLPWYLQPSYTPDVDIKLEYDGSVRAGTLPALVERLTADSLKMTEEKFYRDVFLMTFCSFTNANELLDMLVERYEMDHPRELTLDQFTEWRSKKMRRVQARILAIFKMWLEDHHLLEDDPYIAPRLKDFLKLIRSPPSQALSAKLLLQSLEKGIASVNQPLIVPPLQPNLTKQRKNSQWFMAKNGKLISRYDPRDVAAQLMYYEYKLYVKIRPRECLFWPKFGEKSSEQAANLTAFCSTHDKIAAWVKSSVLSHEGLGKRAGMIDYWIRVAEKCRSLHNFSSMSAIVAALLSCTLSRLHLTWAHVGRSNQLETLAKLMEPNGNFSAYRSALQAVGEESCVPFIGVFLTDIVHIQDKLKDKVSFPIPPMLRSRQINSGLTSISTKSLPTSEGIMSPSISNSSYCSLISCASFSSSTSSLSSASGLPSSSYVSSSASPNALPPSEKPSASTTSDAVPMTPPLINFVKYQRLYEAVLAITRFQGRQPTTPESASLQALIAEQLEKAVNVTSIPDSAYTSTSSSSLTNGYAGADASTGTSTDSHKRTNSGSSTESGTARSRSALSNEGVFWSRAKELQRTELTLLDLSKGLEAASELESL